MECVDVFLDVPCSFLLLVKRGRHPLLSTYLQIESHPQIIRQDGRVVKAAFSGCILHFVPYVGGSHSESAVVSVDYILIDRSLVVHFHETP